jgi:hypothetical protein
MDFTGKSGGQTSGDLANADDMTIHEEAVLQVFTAATLGHKRA